VPRAPARPRRRLLKWWFLASAALALACVAGLAIAFWSAEPPPLHLVIDGEEVAPGLAIAGAGGAVAVLVAGVVVLALLLLVPVVVLLVVGALALALVAGLGVPLVALALALAAVTSPLWLVGLVLWLLLRRRPARAVTIHA
jgi:hypothetical protein